MSAALYEYGWLDGRVVPRQKLVAPVWSPNFNYGTGLFEGIMAYPAKDGVNVVALRDHCRRLHASAIRSGFRYERAPAEDEIERAVVETLRANAARDATYVRPVLYHEGNGDIRLQKAFDSPVHLAIFLQEWHGYLPDREGLKCEISPYAKAMSPAAQMKTCGNYVLAVVAKQHAQLRGYDEAIMRDERGWIVEGTSENLIIEWRGRLLEPALERAPILPGITREIVGKMVPFLGLPIRKIDQSEISPQVLNEADGVLLTGTAAEVTPVRSIDFGDGIRDYGEPTPMLQKLVDGYRHLIRGVAPFAQGWLTRVPT